MSDIIKILEAASEFSFRELISHLQSFLENWVERNFTLVYQTSFKHGSFSELQKFCTNLITNESKRILESADFTLVPEKLMISLIQNYNRQVSEVQVWEHVLKWGLAQNPELPSDTTNFSKENFKVLKRTIQQCIPYVRFRYFTSREFSDKVLPYEKILPKELYRDLLKIFLRISDPDSKPNTVDSKIISYQHVELISRWIDRLKITDKIKNSYEFKLSVRKKHCCVFHQSHVLRNVSLFSILMLVIGKVLTKLSDWMVLSLNPIENVFLAI